MDFFFKNQKTNKQKKKTEMAKQKTKVLPSVPRSSSIHFPIFLLFLLMKVESKKKPDNPGSTHTTE
jgi:hypothetical protein